MPLPAFDFSRIASAFYPMPCAGLRKATTDYEALLDVVAKTLAAVVNDGCVVRLLGSDGWLSPVAMDLPFHLRVNDPEAIARLSASATRARSTCC